MDELTLAEFERFLYTEKRLSDNSILNYRRRLRMAVQDCGFDPKDHTAEEVAQWVADQGGSESNNDGWVATFRHYDDFCKTKGWPTGFSKDLRIARRPKRLPKPIEYDDVIKVLEAVPLNDLRGRRDRAILEVLYCGLRNNELCEAKLQNFNNKEVRIVGKGDKERIVPLNDQAWYRTLEYALEAHGDIVIDKECPEGIGEQVWGTIYRAALDKRFMELRQELADQPDRRMFLSTLGHSLSPRRVREIVDRAAKKAGIGYHIHPHQFRHSCATHLLDFGVTDLLALKEVMGHDDIRTLNNYVKVSRAARFDRVNKYHPRQQFVGAE